MKVRISFVSNSSSSSFCCSVCGEEYSGWDAMPSQFDCQECARGHIFCDEHADDMEYVENPCGECDDYDTDKCETCEHHENMEAENEGNVIEAECPVCMFKVGCSEDLGLYLEKEYHISRAEVFAAVKKANSRRRKLHDAEYVGFCYGKLGITEDSLLAELKERFGNYGKFLEYVGGCDED